MQALTNDLNVSKTELVIKQMPLASLCTHEKNHKTDNLSVFVKQAILGNFIKPLQYIARHNITRSASVNWLKLAWVTTNIWESELYLGQPIVYFTSRRRPSQFSDSSFLFIKYSLISIRRIYSKLWCNLIYVWRMYWKIATPTWISASKNSK